MEFKQHEYDYRLVVSGVPPYFSVHDCKTEGHLGANKVLWQGDLRSLIEHILFAEVCKVQLVNDMAAQKNNDPTVLLASLAKADPEKAKEFRGMIE